MPHVIERVLQTAGKAGSDLASVNPGECIHYRTKAMVAGEPDRVQVVDKVLPNGTLVLSDGEYLRRADLVSLVVAKSQWVSDLAEGAEGAEGPADGGLVEAPLPAAAAPASPPPAGAPGSAETSRAQHPIGSEADQTVGAPSTSRPQQPRLNPQATCKDCHLAFQRTSNVQKRCPTCQRLVENAKQRARMAARSAARPTQRPSASTMDAAIAARIEAITTWWTLRVSGMNGTAAAAQIDTPERRQACVAKSLTEDMLRYYIKQYRKQLPAVPAELRQRSRLASAPAPGNADLLIGSKADPTVGAPSRCQPPHLPGTLIERLLAAVGRVCEASTLINRAERALAILEAAP
jgi:hypothetical protein